MSQHGFILQMLTNNTFHRAGLETLNWLLRFAQDLDPESPEYGGIRTFYSPALRKFPRGTQGWLPREGAGICWTWGACATGHVALTAYDLTKDPFYLDRANMIARFVKSTQNLDASDKMRYGTFLVSQGRAFVDVPDASWGGRFFIELYRRTGEKEYLDRAKIAADWLLERTRMSHGGFATFYLFDKAIPVEYSHASDGQHGIFLGSLFEETNDERYAETLVPLANMLSGIGQHGSGAYYMSLRADGTPVNEGWDDEGGHPLIDGIPMSTTGTRQNYYAARFLLEQYRRDGNVRYLESVRRCAEWTMDRYRRDGYLAEGLVLENDEWRVKGSHPDPGCPGAMTMVMLGLNEVEDDPRWLDYCLELSEWTMRWQCHQPEYPDIHGAIMVHPSLLTSYHTAFAAWGLVELCKFLLNSQNSVDTASNNI